MNVTSGETMIDELAESLEHALKNENWEELERFLLENSRLPGPRANLELLYRFAGQVGAVVRQAEPPVVTLEKMLDGWAALETGDNVAEVFLTCCAVLSYGFAGATRPDWWEDETRKLYKAAGDRRWRVREMVAAGFQELLKANWNRALPELWDWLKSDNPLVIRGVVAAIAEPSLLKSPERGLAALELQKEALAWYARNLKARGKEEGMKALRKGLAYTISVAVAASPETGMIFLRGLEESQEKDLQWIARQNLAKKRLAGLLHLGLSLDENLKKLIEVENRENNHPERQRRVSQ
jgi:hypothetical protein